MAEIRISLAAARRNADLTQKEVARRLGVTEQTLVNWEKNRTRIDAMSLMKLSQIYSIPMENIFLPDRLESV